MIHMINNSIFDTTLRDGEQTIMCQLHSMKKWLLLNSQLGKLTWSKLVSSCREGDFGRSSCFMSQTTPVWPFEPNGWHWCLCRLPQTSYKQHVFIAIVQFTVTQTSCPKNKIDTITDCVIRPQVLWHRGIFTRRCDRNWTWFCWINQRGLSVQPDNIPDTGVHLCWICRTLKNPENVTDLISTPSVHRHDDLGMR